MDTHAWYTVVHEGLKSTLFVSLSLFPKNQVFGGVNRKSNTLYIHHANVEIPSTTPDQHEPTGRYMFFHKYNVESRPHVKLVIADEGTVLQQFGTV
ncbi:hypothetical protein FBUS_09649 [Fasciolopsis buskii]|uniref:Uncharacterized protein n=1 Tax=Fasciolopsis buskii TaxID=27845 RepID=A0A8E0RTY9_9TREM|nr:hypothetical protein FBUS_09649 [Fasciolopsis buski]